MTTANDAICGWCGKSFGAHLDGRDPGDPIPRVPCTLLKSGFRAKEPPKDTPILELTPEAQLRRAADLLEAGQVAAAINATRLALQRMDGFSR